MNKRIGVTGGLVGAIIAILLSFFTGTAHAATTIDGCRPDQSPGVVTDWEAHHVEKGMTRHQVACLYGVRGHVTKGFWASDQNFYLELSYPAASGSALPFTTVTFLDVGTTGSNYHLARSFWLGTAGATTTP